MKWNDGNEHQHHSTLVRVEA